MTELLTASWRALFDQRDALEVQPVRISRGTPKFWPAAARFEAVEELMPDGWMLGIADMERFGRAYRRKLHVIGLAAIQARLDAFASERPLALVCFEAAPQNCHRGPQGFAGWWLKQTGETIAELDLGEPGHNSHNREVGQLQLDVDQPRPSGAERSA